MDGSDRRRGGDAVHRRFVDRHAAARLAGRGPPLRRGRGDPRRRLRVRVRRRAVRAAPPPAHARSSTSCASSCASASSSTSTAPPAASSDAGAGPSGSSATSPGKYTVERPLHLGAALAGRLDELHGAAQRLRPPAGRGVPAARRPARRVRRRDGDGQAGRRRPARGQAHAAASPPRRPAPTATTARLLERLGRPDLRPDEIAALQDLLVTTGAVDEIEAAIERPRRARALTALTAVPIDRRRAGRARRARARSSPGATAEPRRPVGRLPRPMQTAAPAIEVAGLEKHYGATRAVDGISLRVAPGEVFGLLGPERRGQDDDGRDPRGLPPARRRVGARARARPGRRRAPAPPPHRRDAPGGRPLPGRPAARGAPPVRRPTTTTPTSPTGCSTSSGCGRRAARSSAGSRAGSASACRSRSALVGRPEVRVPRRAHRGHGPPRRGPRRGTSCASCATEGVTVVLTTHAMDEAEQLCDRVAIIDHGRVVAAGHARASSRRQPPASRRAASRRRTGLDRAALAGALGLAADAVLRAATG